MQLSRDPRDLGTTAADGDIDGDHVGVTLSQYCVDGERSLAGALVAQDEFTLPATDWKHRIHGEQPRIERLMDRCSLGNSGSGSFERHLGHASV